MGKIVAIGGGEVRNLETLSIDSKILELSGVDIPKVLFLPTASMDAEEYIESFERVYIEELGADATTLRLWNGLTTKEEARRKILTSDIIYVGGGYVEKMFKKWREYGVDKVLKEAYEKGIVMSGLSAGAVCWCNNMFIDYDKEDGSVGYKFYKGLNLVDINLGVHRNEDKVGMKHLDESRDKSDKWIELDNNSAIEVVDAQYKILSSGGDAYILSGDSETKLEVRDEYLNINKLK
jgi:dipeptidase E